MKLYSICLGMFYVLRSSLVQTASIDAETVGSDINDEIVKKQFSHFANSSGPGVFLTPLIESGLYQHAQNAAMVVPDIMGVRSYSGYLTVNPHRSNQLFFWFFPAQNSTWMDLPLVLWLQGGPGHSSMYGLFEELGPFEMEGMDMKKRTFSWNRDANLLFLDQPVGTGFSFSETNFFHDNGTTAGEELYNAVVQFHELFPNFQRSKFFITGESYAGHYIPVLGHIIHENNPIAKVKINLAGMMLGSPWSDPMTQSNYGAFLYNTGLLDKSQEGNVNDIYQEFVEFTKKNEWLNALQFYNLLWETVYRYIGDVSPYNFLKPYGKISDVYLPFLENNPKLLHAATDKFQDRSRSVYDTLRIDFVHSVKPLIEELLEHYPMVFYSGQLDIICAYPMTATLLRSLNWTGHDLFRDAQRTKWCIRGEQFGYVNRAGNLYEVLIRDAGHYVPKDQPEATFNLVHSLITAPCFGNMLYSLQLC